MFSGRVRISETSMICIQTISRSTKVLHHPTLQKAGRVYLELDWRIKAQVNQSLIKQQSAIQRCKNRRNKYMKLLSINKSRSSSQISRTLVQMSQWQRTIIILKKKFLTKLHGMDINSPHNNFMTLQKQ